METICSSVFGRFFFVCLFICFVFWGVWEVVFVLFVFFETGFLCCPSYPGTHFTEQTGLKHRSVCLSPSVDPGIKSVHDYCLSESLLNSYKHVWDNDSPE